MKDVFHCWEGGSFIKPACLCRWNIFQIPATTREKQRDRGRGIPFCSSGRRMSGPGRRITNQTASKCSGFCQPLNRLPAIAFFFFFQGNQNRFACPTSIWPVTCANFTPRLGRTAPLNAPAAGWWCAVSWAALVFLACRGFSHIESGNAVTESWFVFDQRCPVFGVSLKTFFFLFFFLWRQTSNRRRSSGLWVKGWPLWLEDYVPILGKKKKNVAMELGKQHMRRYNL